MYLSYLHNDFIFSSLFGLLSLIITFFEGKRNKEKYSLKTYLKIFVMVSISVYLAIFIKNSSLLNNIEPLNNNSSYGKASGGSVNLNNYTNVNIGDPDF